MAKKSGWWNLELDGLNHDDLEDWDLEHISKQIKEGYKSGEVVEDGE